MDWNSSALWGIIGLVGGFLISLIFYKISNKSKKIVFLKKSQKLITDNISNIDGLNITYQNKPIKELTTTTITFKAIGKDIINMSDFGKATPLCITTTGEFLLKDNIESTIIYNSNPNNLISSTIKVENEKTMLLEFDYLSQGDEFTLVFLHTGNINVNGKLKSGALLDNNLSDKINSFFDILSYIGLGFLLLFIITVYVTFKGADGTIISIVNFLINLTLGVILINYFKKTFNSIKNIKINLDDTDNTNI